MGIRENKNFRQNSEYLRNSIWIIQLRDSHDLFEKQIIE